MNSIGPLFDLDSEWVTYKSVSRSFNTRGDATETVLTSSIPIIVITSPNPNNSLFSFSQVSDQTIIIYSLTSVSEGDYIVWKSNNWRLQTVKVVDDEPDGSVLYAALCVKEVI